MAATRYALDDEPERWEPGKPLKLLLAGYCGTRNTGADVRVEEMIRQFRRIFTDDELQLSLLTIDPDLTAGYFRGVRQVVLPTIFHRFLYDEVPRHHGVVACEGSMFKSKFANALSTMMAGSLGLASVEGKLSVGYGAEAGHMDEGLTDFVRSQLQDSLIICRNEPSRDILEGMGVRTLGGTDTAWTFEPANEDRGKQILMERGWDGKQPVVVMCPINPFWWPAKPDLIKTAAYRLGGQFGAEHYKDIVFHQWSEDASQRYDDYIGGLAKALTVFVKERGAFPLLAGSEQLDRHACEDVAARVPFDVDLFVSDEYDMYDFVSVLRQASLMVSSRYHAIVYTMAAGVPSVGVTMDERIHNLLNDRGHQELLMRVDSDNLGDRVLTAMRTAHDERERISQEVRAFVPGQIRMMGQMGMDFEDEVLRVYPDFPRRDVPRSWEHYVPELSPLLTKLVETHA